MDAPPAQLDYARTPWHRRRTVRRWAVLAGVLACVLLSLGWLKAGWDHARLLYWQRQCLAYVPAGDVIGQPAEAPARAWLEFYALLSPPGRRAAPMVFLHGLTRKDGASRLVAVELSRMQETPGNRRAGVAMSLEYHVIRPGTLWSRPALLRNQTWDARGLYRDGGKITLHAGQVDPADSSHFTVRFEAGGGTTEAARAGIIDGWLAADDSVLLEVREGR